MLEFIISNYIIFIVIAVVLLLGLFGYMMDKKKYEQYREEIVNEERAINTLESRPEVSNVASPVPMAQPVSQESVPVVTDNTNMN
ncbi:MAG: hypothetical protein OSJ70_04510 [Bacilli bacterium]|nr:hypothetical protein [Bacilli bacterium]